MYPRTKHSPKKFGISKTKDNLNPGANTSMKQKEDKFIELNHYAEDKEITLPVLKMVDEKYLLCYKSTLSRPKEEGIGMEDLDRLQMELEMMLSSCVLRQRTLHSEISQISVAEETKSKKTASLSLAKSKRHKRHEDKNDSDNVDTDNPDDNKDSINLSKEHDDREDTVEDLKELSTRYPPKRSIPLVPPSVVPISRNDITNKFWAMIEPYCSEITIDDVKFLEDLVKSYDLYEKEEFKKIPPLGTHYTLRWAQKDMNEEKDVPAWTKSENDVEESDDTKDTDLISSKACAPGPMVQRLVSALVEENPSSSSASVSKRGRLDKETDENCGSPLIKKSKELGLNGFISANSEYSDLEQNYRMLPFFHTSQCFEKKVRKELEAIGFLDPANENNQDDSDEVLTELKRCQEELNNVAAKNKTTLLNLLQITKTEFKRQQIKNQLKVINSELADINMKNISIKLKKKHLCKKEAEDAWKLLKEREALLTKLEEIL